MPDSTLPEAERIRKGALKRDSSKGRPACRANDFLVVGIGASTGGLDACRKLLAEAPAGLGIAFILVQHLDPTHKSMMVDLLAGHISMPVLQAVDGMPIECDHVYVIPPAAYLSIGHGALRLSKPTARHGARLPFDFLLLSLAENFADRAVCVVLSGTGADGSLGLRAVKAKGGMVIAQDPEEAGADGMPRSAIGTGAVDHVLPVSEIVGALISHGDGTALTDHKSISRPNLEDPISEVLDLLRATTAHDFTLYKRGTLQRRIERRMAMMGITNSSMEQYLDHLRLEGSELDLLAKDLLISVTGFFRDPKTFDLLAETIIPEIVRNQPSGRPIRIWVAGCSAGEEAYSLAMLFSEAISTDKRNIKLQIFASDVSPEAIARAREGLYPFTIKAEISAERLSRFFAKEDHGYRALQELRAAIVFTVQDVLADPPFSHLDLVSCRNLLIYLRPEAQDRVISLFHFALRDGGVLLLGGSETIGDPEGSFDVIAKPERIYKRIGRRGTRHFDFANIVRHGPQALARSRSNVARSQQEALGELCGRLVIDAYAPAAALINQQRVCLHSQGPTDRYLRVAAGHPGHDILTMAREGVRSKLALAIRRAYQENAPVAIGGGRTKYDGVDVFFKIAAEPILHEGEQLLLICFIDEPSREKRPGPRSRFNEDTKVEELEKELDATRLDLRYAIQSLEVSNEEQKAINEEAMSVNEEYQSTNEELLTSKEELQSLNEELTALNGQLQETLERQRTASDDLRNILYSTDVATLFLDTKLNIRFFTPTTKFLFNIIASDVGRPLGDINAMVSDDALLSDARTVMDAFAPIEREIQSRNGAWYNRRILPYRTGDDSIEGAVITFADITERKRVAGALEDAKHRAELASAAKSRFLAAASHDLRQPLQVVTLLQGLLAKTPMAQADHGLVALLGETLISMSDMLNTLLDINRIESGNVHVKLVAFKLDDLFVRLKDEFAVQAGEKGLDLRVVSCGLTVESDPHLLEQLIRNLLSNAVKYTQHGKILLGCRRYGSDVSIEVWDTGAGIPKEELKSIFKEYYQLDNAARDRRRGLGLGLSIVEHLGALLNHRVSVRSRLGKGSVFAVEVKESRRTLYATPQRLQAPLREASRRVGSVLIVEDDPDVRRLIQVVLERDGHQASGARDGEAALDLLAEGKVRPDVILVDYNLPGVLNGLQLVTKIREVLRRKIPIIVLTGDTSTAVFDDVLRSGSLRLNKPVKLEELAQAVQRLLEKSHLGEQDVEKADAAGDLQTPTVFVVDDDTHVRDAICAVLEQEGRNVKGYASCEAFLEAYRPGLEACLLVDAYLPGMSGVDLLQRLGEAGDGLPAIMITGNSDVHIAVKAMKAGALDFIEKPIDRLEVLACVAHALEVAHDSTKLSAKREAAASRLASLTNRQREIMAMVLSGHPSKNIAADLNISQRTVEGHRASIMKKTGAKSLPALARLVAGIS
jgi:two-component system, chemotaxis family, CheB/CheR fusion protein